MKNKVILYRCITAAGLLTLILFMADYDTARSAKQFISLWVETHAVLTLIMLFTVVNLPKRKSRDAWGSKSRHN